MQIGSTGPVNDRRWMLVDENNQFLTLRTVSKLAEIKTSIQGPFLHIYAGSNKILVNTNEDCEQIENVTIWDVNFKAGVENKSINEALSDFMNKTVKLVRYQKESFRDLQLFATDTVKETTFTDDKPILLINKASLADLNSRLASQGFAESLAERFRANIIIEGLPAYKEDEIESLSIQTKNGPLILKNPKLCGRCPVITQDAQTGKVVSKETLATLANYRKKPDSTKVAFGVYLTPAKHGLIQLGDQILF